MKSHIVIYSHGFGVRKDDRGMFMDVASALPDFEHIMFDYNQIGKDGSTITTKSLTVQAAMLGKVIAETREKNPNTAIDLVAHSQGCVVAALLKPSGIRRAVFIGAPAMLSADDMKRLFAKRPGSELNMDGISKLVRADFSHTFIPKEYWNIIRNIDPIQLYNDLSKATNLVLINATQDEVIGSRDFQRLRSDIRIYELDTGHNFEGEARNTLVELICQEVL